MVHMMTQTATDTLHTRNLRSLTETTHGGWQVDRLIGDNPVASINVALMMGAVVGWLLKQR